MKIYSIKSGVDLELFSSNYGQATEGLTGDENKVELAFAMSLELAGEHVVI